MDTILNPLTFIDAAGVDRFFLTLGSLFTTPVDPIAISEALSRVTTKWRLLAGRLVWDLKSSRWAVKVPTGEMPDSYKRFAFSATTSSCPAPFAIPALSPTTAGIIAIPPVEHFKVSGAPASAAQLAKMDAPIVAVRVATFADCQVVGITVPHGVFDGVGLGMIVKAIDAELHGRSWTVPLPFSTNPLALRISQLHECASKLPLYEADNERRQLGTGSGKSPWDLARLVFSIVREKVWHRCTPGEVFVGREIMEKTVKRVKEEVRVVTDGKEWVSTGDVLVALTQKLLYSYETTNSNFLLTTAVWDIRSVVSSATSPLSSYPHNALALLPIPSISISSLSETPLSSLALLHRRALTVARTLPALSEALPWTSQAAPIPACRSGTEALNVSNQTAVGLTSTDWGAKDGEEEGVKGWWAWGSEEVMPHTANWNEVRDGWILNVSMREKRWRVVEKELERMSRGADVE